MSLEEKWKEVWKLGRRKEQMLLMKHSLWRVCVLAELHRSWVISEMPSLFCTCVQKCVMRMMILNSHWQALLAECYSNIDYQLGEHCSQTAPIPLPTHFWGAGIPPGCLTLSLKSLKEWFGVGSEMHWGGREVSSSASVLVCDAEMESPVLRHKEMV